MNVNSLFFPSTKHFFQLTCQWQRVSFVGEGKQLTGFAQKSRKRLKRNGRCIRLCADVSQKASLSTAMGRRSRFIAPPPPLRWLCSVIQLCHHEIECTWQSVTSTRTIFYAEMMSHAFLTSFGWEPDWCCSWSSTSNISLKAALFFHYAQPQRINQ